MAAETAQAKLVTSESSWSQQRQALDREIADLTTRYGIYSVFVVASI